jgi:hypothetical protein
MKKKNQLLKHYKSLKGGMYISLFSPEEIKQFLSTQEGYDWLKTDDGNSWLDTDDGYDWLKTDDGWSWLGTIDGNEWLRSSYGIDWIRDTDTSIEWLLLTKQGRKFHSKNKNLGIFNTNDFLLNFNEFIKSYISSEEGYEFIASEQGYEFLASKKALKWLKSNDGSSWLDTDEGYIWLKTYGLSWLETEDGYKWLISPYGIDWKRESDTYKEWSITNEGKKFKLFEKFYNYYKINKGTNIEEIIQLFISNSFTEGTILNDTKIVKTKSHVKI